MYGYNYNVTLNAAAEPTESREMSFKDSSGTTVKQEK
jgi:hypothetical protein